MFTADAVKTEGYRTVSYIWMKGGLPRLSSALETGSEHTAIRLSGTTGSDSSPEPGTERVVGSVSWLCHCKQTASLWLSE